MILSKICYIDVSEFVNGNSFYWNEVQKIINSYQFDEYYKLDNDIKKCSLQDVLSLISILYGNGEASISLLANNINENNYYDNEITIITAGQVSYNEIKNTEKLIGLNRIKNVEFYIIDKNITIDSLNVSIPFIFMKNSDSKLYMSNSSESFKMIKEIHYDEYHMLDDITSDNVIDSYDKLYNLITIKLKSNEQGLPYIKTNLLRIRNEVIGKMNEDFILPFDKLITMCDSKF